APPSRLRVAGQAMACSVSDLDRRSAMSTVTTQDSGHGRRVTVSRAEKRNAMSAQLVLDLHEALRETAGNPDVHCVVVRGEGPVFSAGIDLQDLAGTTGSTSDLRALRRRMLEPFNLCEEMPKPVV